MKELRECCCSTFVWIFCKDHTMKKIILAVQVEPMLGVITQEAVYTLNKSQVHLSKLLNSLFSGHHTQIKETTLLEKKKIYTIIPI